MSDDAAQASSFELLVADADAASAEPEIAFPAGDTVEAPQGPGVDQAADAAGSGLAARLQAHLEVLKRDTVRGFPAPGWGGRIVLEMRAGTPQELSRGRVHGEFVAAFCTRVVIHDEEVGTVEHPGFGPSLAGDLGMPSTTPPATLVRTLFADNSIWLAAFVDDVVTWMAGKASDHEAALGE